MQSLFEISAITWRCRMKTMTEFENPAPRRRDLSWLAGTWSAKDERDFNAAVSKCRRIDAEEGFPTTRTLTS